MKLKKIWYVLTGFLLVVSIFVAFWATTYYRTLMVVNLRLESQSKAYLYIPANATFDMVLDSLRKGNYLIHEQLFVKAAERLRCTASIKPGRYQLEEGMSNKTLLRKLILGNQAPVNLVIAGNIRSYEKLAGVLAKDLEQDSLQFLSALYNTDLISSFGFDAMTFTAMFIPNTYQLYWNSSPESVLRRLHGEYEKFWNDTRKQKAEAIPLTAVQVSALASIINEETNKTDEMPRMAGVYINRLRKNIPLQADPTLRYALGNFSIRRVLDVYKTLESPYNTYKYTGLPPGPICIPSIAAIDAVLNYEQHEYLYFCAKDDLSGYHAFAKTLAQHNQNAAKYQQMLNRNRIYR